MKIKLSDYVWKYVAQYGIRHVFMFPGGGAMHLVDSLGRNKDIEYITLMHEQACSMAAETYSRITNNIGAVLVTTGPGGTNAITGVAAAWLESTPCIIISGQVKTSDLKDGKGIRQSGNQEIGIVDIVKTITKYAVTIREASEIKYHLEKALYLAKCGRQGPVWIDIPLDIQATIIDTEKLKGFCDDEKLKEDQREELINNDIDKTIQILKKSKRPVILVGQGIERSDGKKVFRELVDVLRTPILTSWIGTELLEFDNEFNFGKPGMVAPRYSNFVIQNSDCLICIGSRLDSSIIGYNQQNFAPQAKKIIVDIDKYEIDKLNIDIEVKAVCDGTIFIKKLKDKIEKKNIKLDIQEWIEKCKACREKYPILLEKFKAEGNYVNPYYFIDTLSDELKDDDVIIPGSSGAGIDVFWLSFKNKKNQRLLATGSLGSMGYGIPAAIGACLASNRKRTICIEGDGSVQLNIQEFASIVGMKLPIKIFIFNNGGYLSIMNMQRTHFNGNLVGANVDSKLYIPNIVEVAKAYGFNIFTIENHKEMRSKIKEVLSLEGPVLCDVKMSSKLVIQPRVMSRVCSDGSIKSGELEDLWPFIDSDKTIEN